MKAVIPVFYIVVFMCTARLGFAQNYYNTDSATVVWLNSLPGNPNIPCDEVRLMVFDTLGKIMRSRDINHMELAGLRVEALRPCDKDFIAQYNKVNFLKAALPASEPADLGQSALYKVHTRN